MPNPNPIPKTENLTPWPEGVSGNPAGRPRGSLGDRLRALLTVETEDGKTVGDKFLEAAIEASKKGDFRFFKEIFDRHDGPIAETTPDDAKREEPKRIIVAGSDARSRPRDTS